MIEINLNDIYKAEKTIRVKGTSKRKAHMRTIKGGKGTSDKDLSKVVSDYEQTIKDQDYESCGGFDSVGNVIVQKDGSKDLIQLTEEEGKKLKGATFTHNHPRGTSFSDSDIHTACGLEMKEIRVICRDGGVYLLKMKDGSNLNSDLWNNKIELNYFVYGEIVYNEFERAIKEGEMTIADANSQHYHRVWEMIMSEIDNVIYEKV